MAKIFKLEHRVAVFSKTFYLLLQQNNLQDLLGESHKKLNVIVATVLLLFEKKKEKIFFPRMKNLHTKKTYNGSDFGWLIRQMSINQKSGRQTFRRRFVSGSLFVSPCPPPMTDSVTRYYIWQFYTSLLIFSTSLVIAPLKFKTRSSVILQLGSLRLGANVES